MGGKGDSLRPTKDEAPVGLMVLIVYLANWVRKVSEFQRLLAKMLFDSDLEDECKVDDEEEKIDCLCRQRTVYIVWVELVGKARKEVLEIDF
ncbi:hypothetical protein BHE74_00008740 [Ensete ventricosum]|nr:hypothetical protein BHE74_00008740 [Ensete ventricosum]